MASPQGDVKRLKLQRVSRVSEWCFRLIGRFEATSITIAVTFIAIMTITGLYF